MNINEMEALAKQAKGPHEGYTGDHAKQRKYLLYANPETILRLIELVRLQHEALAYHDWTWDLKTEALDKYKEMTK
jgi:hypothetical protein